MKKIPGTAPSRNMRKEPTQERAQKTIAAIFEATARIVESEGEAALTTNKVAQKAGFSIGTLYQYFPSKEAIVLAMSERERRRVMDELQAMMTRAVQERRDAQDVVREVVRTLVESFASGPRLRRAMVRMVWRMDHYENIVQALREAAERNALAMAQLGDPRLRPPNPVMMFVATRAVMGVIATPHWKDPRCSARASSRTSSCGWSGAC